MQNKFILVFCILFYLISSLWFAHFSLSLDELTTYWTIKDGFGQAFRRAWTYQGQTPLYYIFLWVWKNLFGSNEIVLRLPSIFFGLIAGIFTFKISTKWFGDKVGLWTAILFFTSFEVIERSMLARPYSMGIMSAVCSIYFLESWLSNFSSRSKYLYIFFTILTIYSHYFFSGILILHILFILFTYKSIKKIQIDDVVLVIGYIFLGIALVFPQIKHLSTRDFLSWAPEATIFDLFWAWAPAGTSFSLLLIFIIFIFENNKNLKFEFKINPNFFKLLSWVILPALFIFSYYQISGNSTFTPRYFCWAIPARLVLVVYLVISIIKSRIYRGYLFSFAVFCNLLPFNFHSQLTEDWDKASDWINNQVEEKSNTPIFLYNALIESKQIAWLMSPDRKDYLSSPLSLYPIKGEIFLMPYDINAQQNKLYLTNLIDSLSRETKEIFMIKYEPGPNIGDYQYFSKYFEQSGFKKKSVKKFHGTIAGRWERR